MHLFTSAYSASSFSVFFLARKWELTRCCKLAFSTSVVGSQSKAVVRLLKPGLETEFRLEATIGSDDDDGNDDDDEKQSAVPAAPVNQ
ncbi:hypothetical protein K0M31_008974 [Melipona bicolor]|uniref:Uncharacterized protein n=1 Tax=Melipona bicolor TaxID=60889 RepID=A0AA40FNT1_9HYME|nr:hypothetical protein K0M31_008974 [Melipona bicolor]